MSRRARADTRLIVALDFPAAAPAVRMARRLRGAVRTVKIGSALFTACGPVVVRQLRALGFQVMLDLKFFDIPSTVELSCRAAAWVGSKGTEWPDTRRRSVRDRLVSSRNGPGLGAHGHAG